MQDAAAALPARLFGDVRGKAVADLCAAPGGKTAQLAFAGARVTAVDRSPARLGRLRENLTRLELQADIVAADALEWQGGPFDAVLLDAPCSSTGTIRRHPDIPWLKSEADIAALASLQQRLLDRAVDLLKPGRHVGLLHLLARARGRRGADRGLAGARSALRPRACCGARGRRPCRVPHPDGELRTLPPQLPDPDPRWGGLDGFYAARLTRDSLAAVPAYWHALATLRYRMDCARESGRAAGDERLHEPVSIAERLQLFVLLARRAFRCVVGRIGAHPLLRWRFGPAKTDRLIIAPQDLRTADATRASEIYAGRFAFAGKVVMCDRRSPFEMTPPSDEWAVMLLSFAWLRHLRAADSAITRANARSLVDEWINLQGGWHPLGWRVDILSRRIVCWLSQAPLILQDADARFYRRFLRSLTRQVRYLRRSLKQSRDGLPRLQAVIALTYASLCMPGQSGSLRGNARRLIEELRAQILPDGGHISRNPGALIELLLDLLPLRQVFSARHLQPPPALNNAIDRMMPMLRFFRHGDGNFALFNGMGPTPADLLATVLAYDDARGAPLSNAPHSGYQRIEAGATALLMDTGRPPPLALSQEAHAGCLSFELSWKQQRLVVNCGLPAVNKETWRQVARATAAHSTVTFNDASSCRFLECRRLGGCCRRADRRRPARRAGDARGLGRRHDPARLARRLCRRLRRDPSARAAACARRPHARRRGQLHAGRRRQLAGGQSRRIRGALSPASLDQGQPPDRRPRRDPAVARPRGVDLHQPTANSGARSRRASFCPARTARAAPCRS